MCDMTHRYVQVMSHHVCSPSLICDMTYSYVWHGSCICVTWLMHMCRWYHITHPAQALYMKWLMHMCDMAHVYVWHGSSICAGDVTSRMQPKPPRGWHVCDTMCDLTHSYVWHHITISYVWHDLFTCVLWHDSFICDTWLIHLCDRPISYVWHDSFTDAGGVLPRMLKPSRGWHVCDTMYAMTHSFVWHESFMCATWLIYKCDMTHSHVWHGSCTCVTRLIDMCRWCHVTHAAEASTRAYGWHHV